MRHKHRSTEGGETIANTSSPSRARRTTEQAPEQEQDRQSVSSRLTRIKATFVDHILWTKFNLKLVMEEKTLQQWVQEQIEELNKVPLSSIRPVPLSQRIRLSPSSLERKHWVPVRVDPDQYRKARWRWSAMGISMSEWFYARIKSYAEDVDLDAAEKAILRRTTAGQAGLPESSETAPQAPVEEAKPERP